MGKERGRLMSLLTLRKLDYWGTGLGRKNWEADFQGRQRSFWDCALKKQKEKERNFKVQF